MMQKLKVAGGWLRSTIKTMPLRCNQVNIQNAEVAALALMYIRVYRK